MQLEHCEDAVKLYLPTVQSTHETASESLVLPASHAVQLKLLEFEEM